MVVSGRSAKLPFKIGLFCHAGWIGYLLRDVFFVKRFTPQPSLPHPDMHCNCEVCVWNRFLEVETLRPLTRLDPGATVVHVKTWELHRVPGAAPTIDAIRNLVKLLGLP